MKEYNFIKTYKIIILSLLLCSCKPTSYKLKECCVTDGIEHCSTAEIKTYRKFENGLHIITCGSEFKAGTVDTTDSMLEKAGASAILKLIEQVEIK